MINKALITRCKSMLRGEIEGDRMVAMVALHKAGLTITKSKIAEIRATFQGSEDEIRRAYDVYDAIMTFIRSDRRGNLREAMTAAHLAVNRYNKYNGLDLCKWTSRESEWLFTVNNVVLSYSKNRYDKSEVEDLIEFFISNSNKPAPLQCIHMALNTY